MKAALLLILLMGSIHPASQSLDDAYAKAVSQKSLPALTILLGEADGPETKLAHGVRPLMLAAAAHWTEGVHLILERGARVDDADESGETALIKASVRGGAETIKELLDAGANPKNRSKDGQTALHRAAGWDWDTDGVPESEAEQDSERAVQLLLTAGSDPNSKDRLGRTPLMLAADKKHYLSLDALLSARADLTEQDLSGRLALTYAAQFGSDSDGVQSLVKAGAVPRFIEALLLGQTTKALSLLDDGSANVLGPHGETALHLAAADGSLSIVERLIKMNLEVDATDDRGIRPLMLATGVIEHRTSRGVRTFQRLKNSDERAAIICALCKAGADIDAFTNVHGAPGRALDWAAAAGSTETVRALLSCGADPNPPFRESTTSPLQLALQNARLDSLKVLLAKGADVNLGDPSPLHFAARLGNTKILEALLDCLPKLNAVESGLGRTPLQWAVQAGKADAVRMLMIRGADATHKDNQGLTAMDIALALGNTKVIQALRESWRQA